MGSVLSVSLGNSWVGSDSFMSMQVNPALVEEFEGRGMKFVCHDVGGQRMEIMELKGWHCTFLILIFLKFLFIY